MSRPVFVAEHHHDILNAWAEIRRGRDAPFRLITFDFHTDTLPAFNRYALKKLELDLGRVTTRPEHAELCAQLAAAVDFRDAASVKRAVSWLRHDEHIDCARRAGMVSDVALVLSTDTPGNTPDFGLLFPASSGASSGVPTPQTGPFGEICGVGAPAQVAAELLESPVLAPKVAAIAEAWGGLGEYIVDIDLDFFRSSASAAPREASAFEQLLLGSLAVTIARESRCVVEGRLPGESITADSLLAQLRRFTERGRS